MPFVHTEVALDSSTIVGLLSETAAQLKEDLELMKAGVIKCECFGAEVTEQHTARMAASLARIEAVIDAQHEAKPRFRERLQHEAGG